MPSFYEILEVSRRATPEEIRTSYRRLAIKYHPDKNPGDVQAEKQFRLISEAYRILADTERRQLYDLYGDAGLAGLEADGFNGFDDLFSVFGDTFGDFFSHEHPEIDPNEPQPGADLNRQVVISLEEVGLGADFSVPMERRMQCPQCGGSGTENGDLSGNCPRCQGSKFIDYKQKIQVRVPAGVNTGTRLRLRGEGEPGLRGGLPGDLYLEIQVAPHPVFTRRNQDLYCRTQLSFVEASLGTEVEVPTLTSHTRVVIPPGTQPGETIRVPGLGLPGLRGKPGGALVVVVDLQTPTHLSHRQQHLLREFLRLAEAEELDGVEGLGA